LNKRPEDQTQLTDYAHMHYMIQERLDESSYDPRHFREGAVVRKVLAFVHAVRRNWL
jgi:hypothetical protein